jgi:ribosomal protein S18 acetylase RimI-like enzyme
LTAGDRTIRAVTAIEAAAHTNFARAILWTARLLPGASTTDRDGLVAVVGTIDLPSFRLGLRTSDALDPTTWVTAAEEFLFADGNTACVYARVGPDDEVTALLVERGFLELATLPEMACEPPLDTKAAADGFVVRLATTEEEVAGYARVAGEAFTHLGMQADVVEQVLSTPGGLLASDIVLAIVERPSDGAVVAGAFAIVDTDGPEPMGYVAYVSCADDERGHGLGDSVTRFVTREAFARGARVVTLEASPFGRNTYARMGYRTLYDYRLLIKV